jgi:hypothetical protein
MNVCLGLTSSGVTEMTGSDLMRIVNEIGRFGYELQMTVCPLWIFVRRLWLGRAVGMPALRQRQILIYGSLPCHPGHIHGIPPIAFRTEARISLKPEGLRMK